MYLNNLSYNEKKAFYSLATALMNADGDIAENEIVLLNEFLKEMDIEKPGLSDADSALVQFNNSTFSTRKKVYFELIGLSMCDNNFAESEEKFLKKIADNFGLSFDDTEKLMDCLKELMDVYSKMAVLLA